MTLQRTLSIVLFCLIWQACASQICSTTLDIQSCKQYDTISLHSYTLNACFRKDPNRPNIQGVIEIAQTIDGNQIFITLDYDLGLIRECPGHSERSYLKHNSIIIADNEINLGECVEGVYIGYCLPSNLFYAVDDNLKWFVLELNNFSHTSVGGGYLYYLICLDGKNKIISSEISSWGKDPKTEQEIKTAIKSSKEKVVNI